MYVDTRRVIDEVRFHPSLWNQSCELYKDRDVKGKAWIEVCQATIEGFDDLSESEKIVIEKQIQQRWKTARDAYVKCKAMMKNTKSGNKYKYVYFDRMRFLDDYEQVDTEESISGNQSATDESQANNRLVAIDAGEDFLLPLSNISHTERIINEVRLRPALWDQSCELYKDRHAKIKAWLEICRAIAPNFNDLSDSKKKVIEKQVQQRWKTARDAYIRCKNALKRAKSKSGSKNQKKYVYFEIMQFLDKKKQIRSILAHQNTVNESQAYSESATVDSKGFLSNPSLYRSSINDHDYDLSSTSKYTSQSNRIANATFQTGRKIMNGKRKRISEEDNTFELEMLNLFKDNMKLMQNDDMSFFCSLLPITQKFSSQQKLLFRSEVLKKAMEISNNCNSNEDRPRTSHSFSSESQHSDSANLYSTEESVYLYVKEEDDC